MLTKQKYKAANRLILLLLLFILIIPVSIVLGQETSPVVYSIAVDGEITPAMAIFLERKIEDANTNNADGIIIEIKTLGGRVDSAIEMRDAIIASDTPVVVYIESRAISAGALISIAAPTIAMAPGSHIGAAKPSPDDPKTVAFVSGEFRTTAELTGRDPQIAMAMVDESIEIDGLVREGEILDLTANEAFANGYAEFIAIDRNEVMREMGWQDATLIQEEMDFRYRIAQFLTSYEVASLLLSLGMIALIAEFYTQGFGISGIIGIACFVLYFSSGFIAGYTDLWAVVIFFIGVALLIIELTIPEFGVFGISGLIAMVIGIILAAPSVRQGVFSILISILAAIIAIPIFIKVFGKSKFMNRIILVHSETVAMGYVHTTGKSDLTGKKGVAISVLRPSGKVLIDGIRTDAIAEGEFIDSGTQIKVVFVEGSKVVVAADNESQ